MCSCLPAPLHKPVASATLHMFFYLGLTLLRCTRCQCKFFFLLIILLLTFFTGRWLAPFSPGLFSPSFPFGIYCQTLPECQSGLSLLSIIREAENAMQPAAIIQHIRSHAVEIDNTFQSVQKFHTIIKGRNGRPCIYLQW